MTVALTRRFWLTLLGTALAVRLVINLGVLSGLPLASDALAYSEQARDFLRNYADSPASYWPPGTSYVLVPFYEVLGAGAQTARLAMILVSLANVALATLIARRVLNDVRAVQFTGWIMALLPALVFMPSQPFSGDVTMLGLLIALLGALAGYDRRQPAFFALGGLGLALAALARPGSLSFGAALGVIGVIVLRRRLREGDRRGAGTVAAGIVAFAVFTAAPLIPALVHNDHRGQGLTLSTNNEGNLLFGNNPYTRDYKTWLQGQHPLSYFPPQERAYLAEHFGADTVNTLAERRQMRDDAIDYITGHPGVFLLRTANRIRAYWGFDYTFTDALRNWESAPTPAVALGALLEVGSWLLVAVLALIGLLRARARFLTGRVALLLALVLAYALPYTIAFSAGRWHMPVLSLIVMFAGAGLAQLGSSKSAWRALIRDRALLVAVVIFGLIQAEYAYWVVTG